MTTLINDIKYGIRQLVKNPGFTVTAILTLAIGIGANVTMFSVINTVLLRPLPFEEADRLVVIRQQSKQHGFISGFSYPDFLDCKKQDSIFEDFAAYKPARFDLAGEQGTVKIDAAEVSDNFFSLLKVSPHLGRIFASTEQSHEDRSAVVIGHAFWRSHFNEEPEVLGRTLTLDGQVYTVVGVLPPGFHYPESLGDARVWTLLNPTEIGRAHV